MARTTGAKRNKLWQTLPVLYSFQHERKSANKDCCCFCISNNRDLAYTLIFDVSYALEEINSARIDR